MNTAIIVLHYGSIEDTISCLRSLDSLENADDVVVYLIDNGTNKLNKNILNGLSIRCILLKNKTNLGYAGGNNVGIRQAIKNNHKNILLLNNDATVDSKLLVTLEKVLRKKDVGIVGCVITYTGSKRIWFAGGILNRTFCFTRHRLMDEILTQEKNIPEENVDFITGAAMLIKREVFEKIGLLPEDYFLYWEDVDFCYKANQAGFKNVIVNKPLVQHSVSAASGKRGSNKLSPTRAYYYARNPFIFMKKNRLPLLTAILGQICIRLPHSMLLLSSYSSLFAYLEGLIEGFKYLILPLPSKKSSHIV